MDATNDLEGTKPIIIVGTHADKLSKKDRQELEATMEQLYPFPSQKANRSQIEGHFSVSLSDKKGIGLSEIRTKLLTLALSHPKIGVGRISVPRSFVMLQTELQELKKTAPYYYWQKYSEVAESIGMY